MSKNRATGLKYEGLFSSVQLWQAAEGWVSNSQNQIELRWRGPDDRLIKMETIPFEHMDNEALQEFFRSYVELVETKEWLEAKSEAYMKKITAERNELTRKLKICQRKFGGAA